MASRRATVFGATGFVGRYVVERLARQGAVVQVACRRPEDARRLRLSGDVGQIVPVPADLRDPASVDAALEGADLAVNLVGILRESRKASFRAIHFDGAAHVARAATAAGVSRLVHLSALGADSRSISEYSRSKAAGEATVLEHFPGATILRPGVVFGPEDRFFNKFAALARFSPVLPLFGCPPPRLVQDEDGARVELCDGGGTRFQPVWVADVADAVMAALDDRRTAGRIYELGGPAVLSWRDLMQMILTETGRRRLLVPVPLWYVAMWAFFLELVPGPPLLTRDQVRMLRRDNVVAPGALTLADLGIAATAVEAVLPTYMDVWRAGGRFRKPLAT